MVEDYFVCANSNIGFVNFFPHELKNSKKVYIIKGGPGTGKSSMMRKIGNYFEKNGCDIGCIHCSSDCESLDGVVIKDYNFVIVDGTSPHVVEPTAPGAIEEYISLSNAWDSKALASYRDNILKLNNNISNTYKKMYAELKDAGKIYAQIQKIHMQNTDFDKIERLAEALDTEIFKTSIENPQHYEKHRFSDALTPWGLQNYAEELTQRCDKRFLVKGGIPSEISAFMENFSERAKEFKTDMEIYHSGFDPKSITIIHLPSLKVALLNATTPSEIFPSGDNDIILDFTETTAPQSCDDENSALLELLDSGFNEHLNKARSYLKTAKSYHDELESIYIENVDFDIIDNITDSIIYDMENNIF